MHAATAVRSSRAARPPLKPAGARHVYALTLEYDGAGFSGWQRQPGRRTVEGTLQQAIADLCGESAPLTPAGRTDAGAHAPRAGATPMRTIHAVDTRRLSGPDAGTDAAAPPGGAPPDAHPQTRSVVVIDVTADAFLYGMMRAIAGALVAVGSGSLGAERIAD